MSNYTFNVIWKFPFQIIPLYQEIEFPTAFKPVHLGFDPTGVPCIWAMVDSTKNKRKVAVYVVGTGQPLPEDQFTDHVGSFIDGSFVWHVFIRPIF